ncbi:PAP2 domain-containing protein [Thozetella sp. PMI_491]|nr:PAP2 domain-containing protein [Thozetella sp. PMI_491]
MGKLLLTASYIFDWVILVAFAVVGFVVGNLTPNKRPFELEDTSIAFPFTVHETVTLTTLVLVSILAPIGIILIVTLLFVPGPTVPRGTPRALVWRRKLWELHTGFLGLAFSLALAWFITSGLKNLMGKPRPDLLSRCLPDLTNASKYIVGGFTSRGDDGVLVSADICTNTDKSTLDDGFRSFPSGHSTMSASGLVYLSLFLLSKLAITTPFYVGSHRLQDEDNGFTAFPSRLSIRSKRPSPSQDPSQNPEHASSIVSIRRQAAAPPLYLFVIAVAPFLASVFISASRWFDFRHHGFDILFGYLIGALTSFFAFRYYHLPINGGAGWSWGPRNSDKAFWSGVGNTSYATEKKEYELMENITVCEYRSGWAHANTDPYGFGCSMASVVGG